MNYQERNTMLDVRDGRDGFGQVVREGAFRPIYPNNIFAAGRKVSEYRFDGAPYAVWIEGADFCPEGYELRVFLPPKTTCNSATHNGLEIQDGDVVLQKDIILTDSRGEEIKSDIAERIITATHRRYRFKSLVGCSGATYVFRLYGDVGYPSSEEVVQGWKYTPRHWQFVNLDDFLWPARKKEVSAMLEGYQTEAGVKNILAGGIGLRLTNTGNYSVPDGGVLEDASLHMNTNEQTAFKLPPAQCGKVIYFWSNHWKGKSIRATASNLGR